LEIQLLNGSWGITFCPVRAINAVIEIAVRRIDAKHNINSALFNDEIHELSFHQIHFVIDWSASVSLAMSA
jgi:hypothetical protein